MAPPTKRACMAEATISGSPKRQTRLQVQQKQMTFPFLQLPAEIRLLIYPLAGLDFNGLRNQKSGLRRTTPSILLINRQIYSEAKPMLLDRTLEFAIPQRISTFSNLVSEGIMTQIKRVSIIVDIPSGDKLGGYWAMGDGRGTNSIAQMQHFVTPMFKIWKEKGHNLLLFEIKWDDDQCLEHVRHCHSQCIIRYAFTDLFNSINHLRGIGQVRLSGKVWDFFQDERDPAVAEMMKPIAPTLNKLPEKILTRIIGPLIARPDHVQMWKNFETPIWDSLSEDLISETSRNTRSPTEMAVIRPTTRSLQRKRASQDNASSDDFVRMYGHDADTVKAAIMSKFNFAFQTLEEQNFSSPTPFRISQSLRELSLYLANHGPLVFDQPFLPIKGIYDLKGAPEVFAGAYSRTVSPFMTNNYLQAVRIVVLEYHPSFNRNWLWAPFLTALAEVWKCKHHLHKLTLRIVDPDNNLDETERKQAVKAFASLASVRRVNIVEFDGPFKPADQWKLERMTTKKK